MEYLQITIATEEQAKKEILIALLGDGGYEGFEEKDEAVIAFIPQADFDEETLKNILTPLGLEYTSAVIPQQNWNAKWESNFEPVIIEDFCTVRAFFHTLSVTTPYDIQITPKMSFGTGHHATTRLMMQEMAAIDFTGKNVFDFGTGTGILAILAEMLGASSVLAVDNDEWAYQNTLENVQTNSCTNVEVKQGSINTSGDEYDIILANINRHILLEHMDQMYQRLTLTGTLLLSGLLIEDKIVITEAAEKAGFKFEKGIEYNGWITLLFKKIVI